MAHGDPLVGRFPALLSVPRVDLGVRTSPVEQWAVDPVTIWVKRDDLNAPRLGGNKVRALEFLLADLAPHATVVTVGGIGSTHVLATAVHARALRAGTIAWRWPHEENDVSRLVASSIMRECERAPLVRNPAEAFARAYAFVLRHRARWVPFGGTSPLGVLGHLQAALELAEQVGSGELPVPRTVFVPMGTGGTAVGLALGLGAARLSTTVVAVRCGPHIRVEVPRLRWLARKTRGLMRRFGVPSSALPVPVPIQIEHGAYAGAYARPLPAAAELARRIGGEAGRALDATYSAKACYAAWRAAGAADDGPVLFWHTFDGRWMHSSGAEPMPKAR